MDKADQIINLLQQLLEQTAKDEEAPVPGMAPAAPEAPMTDADEVDPMAPLNNFKKELGDEEPEGPAEAESNFVDPESINEEDEDELNEIGADPMTEDEDMEMVNVPSMEKSMTDSCKGNDSALRMAIDALKPIIASLPKNQRRAAADAAVRQLRTQMGKDAKPKTNAYANIMKAKRNVGDAKMADVRALGRKITSERNCNAKKH